MFLAPELAQRPQLVALEGIAWFPSPHSLHVIIALPSLVDYQTAILVDRQEDTKS